MLISLSEVLNKYNLNPKSVIHVGAHWAEEHDDYIVNGIEKFVYIEPCKEAFDILVEKFVPNPEFGEINKRKAFNYIGVTKGEFGFYNYACGSEEKEEVMYVSHDNQGQSNSLLQPALHLTQHPNVVFNDAEAVKVVTLDSLNVTGDMLVMDCQGYEGEVIKGATETLKNVNIVYSEVNRGQTYAGNMELPEFDTLLKSHGFIRVETHWPSPNWTWGDAVYIKIF